MRRSFFLFIFIISAFMFSACGPGDGLIDSDVLDHQFKPVSMSECYGGECEVVVPNEEGEWLEGHISFDEKYGDVDIRRCRLLLRRTYCEQVVLFFGTYYIDKEGNVRWHDWDGGWFQMPVGGTGKLMLVGGGEGNDGYITMQDVT